MLKIRSLLSNINVMNLLLAVVLLFVAYFTFLHSPSVNVRHVKRPVKRAASDSKSAQAKKTAGDDKTPFPTDYVVIAEQNLFHPDRKIPEKKVEKKPGPPEPKPDFVLDGTLMTGETKIAFMEDKKQPVNTPGRPNRQTPLKIGESLSGYTLTEIDKDKVVMRKGDDKVVVDLTDPSKKRQYVSTNPQPAPGPPGSSGNRTRVVNPGPRRAEARANNSSRKPRAESRTQTESNTRKQFFNLLRGRHRE